MAIKTNIAPAFKTKKLGLETKQFQTLGAEQPYSEPIGSPAFNAKQGYDALTGIPAQGYNEQNIKRPAATTGTATPTQVEETPATLPQYTQDLITTISGITDQQIDMVKTLDTTRDTILTDLQTTYDDAIRSIDSEVIKTNNLYGSVIYDDYRAEIAQWAETERQRIEAEYASTVAEVNQAHDDDMATMSAEVEAAKRSFQYLLDIDRGMDSFVSTNIHDTATTNVTISTLMSNTQSFLELMAANPPRQPDLKTATEEEKAQYGINLKIYNNVIYMAHQLNRALLDGRYDDARQIYFEHLSPLPEDGTDIQFTNETTGELDIYHINHDFSVWYEGQPIARYNPVTTRFDELTESDASQLRLRDALLRYGYEVPAWSDSHLDMQEVKKIYSYVPDWWLQDRAQTDSELLAFINFSVQGSAWNPRKQGYDNPAYADSLHEMAANMPIELWRALGSPQNPLDIDYDSLTPQEVNDIKNLSDANRFARQTERFGLVEKVWTAGIGDIFAPAGRALQTSKLRWLGADGLGSQLATQGHLMQSIMPPDTLGPFTWKHLYNPEWWITRIVRQVPMQLALLPIGMIGAYAGSALSGALLGGKIATATGWALKGWKFGKQAIESMGYAIFNRPFESLLEAGSTFDEVFAKTGSYEEADKAASYTFNNNMKLIGMDALEFFVGFNPIHAAKYSNLVARAIAKTAEIGGKLVITGLTEAGEEYYQQIIQMQAAGIPISMWDIGNLSIPELQEVAAIGGLMGIGLGSGGQMVRALQERTIAKMKANLEQHGELQNKIDEFVAQGLTFDGAQLMAIDYMMEKYGKKAAQIVKEATLEIRAEIYAEMLGKEMKDFVPPPVSQFTTQQQSVLHQEAERAITQQTSDVFQKLEQLGIEFNRPITSQELDQQVRDVLEGNSDYVIVDPSQFTSLADFNDAMETIREETDSVVKKHGDVYIIA
ncbi:hypothetical protein KKA53_04965, partial [Candidatus Dependentiae bacterium]|nr:hypothetical protein [Candidatus Dependentiae bacterium]